MSGMPGAQPAGATLADVLVARTAITMVDERGRWYYRGNPVPALAAGR